jgi:hypothetical protein
VAARALTTPPGDTAAWKAFNRAIDSAKVYSVTNVRGLVPLKADAADSITGVTLTADTAPTERPQHGIWITGVPELQILCQHVGSDSVLVFLQRLLGLMPSEIPTYAVVIRASASDVFRPAPNELLNATLPCSFPSGNTMPPDCGKSWADTTNVDYRWLVAQGSFSYQPDTSFPFTHLGYTYNWNPGADRYGASEYVIRAGAGRRIVSTVPTAKYCAG